MILMKRLSVHLQSSPWRDGLALLVLLLLVLLFLRPGLRPGNLLLPLDLVIQVWPPWQQPDQAVTVQNLMLSDPVNYIFPVKQFAADSIRQGVFPLWNPYSLGGYPFVYNTQAGLFYPLSLVYYLLPAAAAVNIVITLQLFLGAAFMYLYLRLIVTHRLAALAGAILFTFNGLMVIWLEWQVVHAAVIWLPLQLFFSERMARRVIAANGEPLNLHQWISGRREAVMAGIALAVPWLGGHWNWTLYTSMTLGIYLLWRLGLPFYQASHGRVRRQIFFLFALPLLIGLALSLVQVWPAATYLSQSHRGDLAFGESLQQGLLNRLPVLLIPNFFGNPAQQNWWGPTGTNYVETTFYLGILPLLLAGLAPLLRRDSLTRFYLLWGGVGFLWALGTPLYGLLYVLPVFGGLLPSRAAILVVFCVSVLTAVALERLASISWPQRLELATLGGLAFLLLILLIYAAAYRDDILRTWDYLRPQVALFLLLCLGSGGLLISRLRGWLTPTWFMGLACLWLTADLFASGYGVNPIASVEDLYPLTSTAQFLHQDTEPFRLTTLAQGAVYPPNTALVHRLVNVSGYEPGILRRVVAYINAAEGANAIRNERELIPWQGANSPLLASFNVKYIVTTEDRWETTPLPGDKQTEMTAWWPLLPNQPLGQRLQMPEAGLHRLDIWLHSSGEVSGDLTVRVFTEDGGQELAHSSLNVAEITQPAWYSFFFAPFPSVWGRAFFFTVEFAGVGEGLAVGRHEAAIAFVSYYLPRPQLVHEDGKTRIYLNEGYLPRAFAVSQALLVDNEADALEALMVYADQLDQWVILEPVNQPLPPPFVRANTAPLETNPLAANLVSITHYGLNEVKMVAQMAKPGFVILADTYYPGWQAHIEGQRTPIYRANSIMRAVYVPAGRHEIHFTFRPPDFLIGAVVSGLTFIGCIIFLFSGHALRSNKPPIT